MEGMKIVLIVVYMCIHIMFWAVKLCLQNSTQFDSRKIIHSDHLLKLFGGVFIYDSTLHNAPIQTHWSKNPFYGETDLGKKSEMGRTC